MAEPGRLPEWVLILEDEPDHRLLMRQAISRVAPGVPLVEKAQVDHAREWLEGMMRQQVSMCEGLVVLDLGLPRASGFDILEWLRDHVDCNPLPAVVITASENPMDAEHAFQLGARGYFQKPADFLEYMEIFRQILKIGPDE
ncbi:MAG: response regulator [Gemmatimonadota bacterium]|nr:response regulator [Gemmatimonadota bacterium]MDH5760736.1 response regulator [Gemmatimonadota bacterium]